LRKNQTEAKGKLWSRLRDKRLRGLKFFRQDRVRPDSLDFYCLTVWLAVEADGGEHSEELQVVCDEGW